VSEYLVNAVILSDLVEPEIPEYALWNARVALRPLVASVYFAIMISGLYAVRTLELGLLIPATQILEPST